MFKTAHTAALLALAELIQRAADAHAQDADEARKDRSQSEEAQGEGHGSGRLGFGIGLSRGFFAQQLGRQVLPGECREHAVADAIRQFLGPLSHGGGGDTNCFGGGRDGSAEQFNGLSFEHGSILAC